MNFPRTPKPAAPVRSQELPRPHERRVVGDGVQEAQRDVAERGREDVASPLDVQAPAAVAVLVGAEVGVHAGAGSVVHAVADRACDGDEDGEQEERAAVVPLPGARSVLRGCDVSECGRYGIGSSRRPTPQGKAGELRAPVHAANGSPERSRRPASASSRPGA